MRRSEARILINDSLSPRMEGIARIASTAVGKLSVPRISAATCHIPSRPKQESNGAERDRSARMEIMGATRLRWCHRSYVRYRRRISDIENRAAVPPDVADAAGRYR